MTLYHRAHTQLTVGFSQNRHSAHTEEDNFITLECFQGTRDLGLDSHLCQWVRLKQEILHVSWYTPSRHTVSRSEGSLLQAVPLQAAGMWSACSTGAEAPLNAIQPSRVGPSVLLDCSFCGDVAFRVGWVGRGQILKGFKCQTKTFQTYFVLLKS